VKFYPCFIGPLGGAGLHFHSRQPKLHDHGRVIASQGMSVYFPAEAGTHLPTPEEWKAESTTFFITHLKSGY